MSYRLRLIGPFELLCPDGSPQPIASRKAQVLIAILAVARGKPVPRSRLADILWADRDQDHARNSLRQLFSAIRRSFTDQFTPPIRTTERDAALIPSEIAVDLDRLAGTDGEQPGVEWLLDRVDREFLEGLELPDLSIQDWLRDQRETVRNSLIATLSAEAEGAIARGEATAAIDLAEAVLRHDPLHEAGNHALMRALAYRGDRVRALKHYDAFNKRLQDELGIAPSAETERLREMIATTDQQQVSGIGAPPGASELEEAIPLFAAPSANTTRRSTEPRVGQNTVALAVLPFVAAGGSAEEQAAANAIVDDIVTELSRNRHLAVTWNRQPDAGRKAADVLLEGSVRLSPGYLRINVHLAEPDTGLRLWAERFALRDEDPIRMQDEGVQRVIGRLAYNLDAVAGRQRSRRAPENDALDHFLSARAAWREGRAAAARDSLEAAITSDPSFARAIAFLAYIHAMEPHHKELGLPTKDSFRRARELIDRAIPLANGDPYTLHRIAMTLFLLGETAKARPYIEHAARENPTDIELMIVHGMILAYSGEYDRGVQILRRPFEIEPRLPPSCYCALSEAYFLVGDYEQALRVTEAATTVPFYLNINRAMALAGLDRPDEARKLLADPPPGLDLTEIARCMARMCLLARDAERMLSAFRTAGVSL